MVSIVQIVQTIIMQQSGYHCHAKQTTYSEVSVLQQTNCQYYSIVQAILMQQSRCHCHAKQTRCSEVSVMQQTFPVSVISCRLLR
jgi:hypothetical protein